MNWNPWKHIRLAGALVCIGAAFINNVALAFLGLVLIAMGTVQGLYRVETILEKLMKEKDE